MNAADIEVEYDQFANPRMESYKFEWEIGRSDPTRTRLDLDSEHARDTIRRYLEVFNVKVEIRKDGDPVWRCEGFDDQNRYSSLSEMVDKLDYRRLVFISGMPKEVYATAPN